MSARSIVMMGVWSLLMVLIGTMTVGVAVAFYVAMVALFVLVVAVLLVFGKRWEGPSGRA